LTEEDVLEYVAATLYQKWKAVVPLAAVIQERSNGNPFYMREMLETCYKKHCLWFSWKANAWEYDLDRVFTEFETEHYGQFLNMSFVTKKLQELPAASRAILAWASLLGNTFSFGLIQKLLSGEFLFGSTSSEAFDVTCPKRVQLFRQSEEDAVAGLQHLLQAYILTPGDTDDEFRFSSDRHLQAAGSMRECHNVQKMHFVIAEALIKYYGDDADSIHIRARHICQAVELIKQRVHNRRSYRNVLFQGAMTATESGARPTALWYYQNCLALLQDDPWDDESSDVFYDETLKIYVQAAEIFWYQGKSEEALNLLADTFAHAKTPACKTRSWILQSRLFAQRGDSLAAFTALKTSLIELGLELEETNWEACDEKYRKLSAKLKSLDHLELLQRPLPNDPDIIAMGTVLIEAMSAAFWTDALLFFQMAVQMISVHLERGPFVQIGLGYTHFAMITAARFHDVDFALKLADLSRSFLNLYREDPYTQGRGWTIHSLFINHFQSPLRQSLSTLEGALEMTYAAGDRILSILNFGAMVSTRLYIGMDMTEIESFCSYITDEFDDWQDDLRGGVSILASR
jgi:predicted ATPase